MLAYLGCLMVACSLIMVLDGCMQGHCIDFHVYGHRYMVDEHKPNDRRVLSKLAAIATRVSDVEQRADLLGTALLGDFVGGRKICYSPVTTLQTLVPAGSPCDGTGEGGDSRLMLHYAHAALQGTGPTT